MAAAKPGDTVNVNYRGLFEDGTVFDSNYETEPFEFTLGENMVVPGFEKAVLGMEVGDEKTVTVPPNKKNTTSRTRPGLPKSEKFS